MARYGQAFKNRAVARLLPPESAPLQVVARDLDSFSQFARDVLLHLPNVKDMHTSFSLGEVKAYSALPLGHLDSKPLDVKTHSGGKP